MGKVMQSREACVYEGTEAWDGVAPGIPRSHPTPGCHGGQYHRMAASKPGF